MSECKLKKCSYFFLFWGENSYFFLFFSIFIPIFLFFTSHLALDTLRVGYRGICHASLVFSVYTRAFRRVCIRRKFKWQVACSTVSLEKALHNYFIPCLSLRKTYGNFGKSSVISANFRKLGKRFKAVFEELRRFMKLLENFGNSSKVFPDVFMF